MINERIAELEQQLEDARALAKANGGRVFIVQDPLYKKQGEVRRKVDLAPAEKYGDLVFLLDWSETPRNMSPEVLTFRMRKMLEEFSDNDYILLIGSFSAMVLAAILAAEANDGRVRLLEWDRDDGDYKVVALDMNCQPLPEMENYRERSQANHRAR